MNDLLRILDTMDVPLLRKNDLDWLKRNLSVRNRNHPDFFRAMRIIHDLTRKKVIKPLDNSDGDDNMSIVVR